MSDHRPSILLVVPFDPTSSLCRTTTLLSPLSPAHLALDLCKRMDGSRPLIHRLCTPLDLPNVYDTYDLVRLYRPLLSLSCPLLSRWFRLFIAFSSSIFNCLFLCTGARHLILDISIGIVYACTRTMACMRTHPPCAFSVCYSGFID